MRGGARSGMRGGWMRIAAITVTLGGGLFVLFVVNQTAQIVALADRVSPVFGTVVLWMLLVLYAAGIGALVWQIGRLPKALEQPTKDSGPAYDRYVGRLRDRLRRNDELAGLPVETEADVKAALDVLGERADETTRDTALQVFLVTAVSQNGSLDALAVIAAQARMVNEIARLYYQRPTVREMLSLYANVATAALIAHQLEEVDMSEYVQPIVSSAMSSLVGSVPGMEAAGTVLVQSLLSGSTNAFLTLRVGIIAKRYCGSVVAPQREAVRRAAAVEAARLIPGIIAEGGKRVRDIVLRAAKTAATNLGRQFMDKTKGAVHGAAEAVSAAAGQIAGGARETATAGEQSVFRRMRNALRHVFHRGANEGGTTKAGGIDDTGGTAGAEEGPRRDG